MDNQDVVIGMARVVKGKQYFRVMDAFTPNRGSPQPDYKFCKGGVCGKDDIMDAIGVIAQLPELHSCTALISLPIFSHVLEFFWLCCAAICHADPAKGSHHHSREAPSVYATAGGMAATGGAAMPTVDCA
jgi:hypothetical protein